MIAYKVSKNAKILFVGINPHPGSFRRGVPFSNNKMFWYLLNRAGLLDEVETELKRDETLKHLYDKKFAPKYALNFVNLVDRPTIDVTGVTKGEERTGVCRALRIIKIYKPKVVCFIGKVTFNKFQGSRKCAYGWQKKIGNASVYLMHFPIRGPASIRVKELREVGHVADLNSRFQSGTKAPARRNNCKMAAGI
jgi:TDG/mug DNA glycosylase family protein